MNYIVFDMEWNRPADNCFVKNDGGIRLIGEIIQIGAVLLDENMKIIDTYKSYIRPKTYSKMHPSITELTGITDEMLVGKRDFIQVIEEFKNWCPEESFFMSWGYDDMPMLENNLMFYNISYDRLPTCYNLQVMFNMQTENRYRQFSLSFAREYFKIEENKAIHDAMNDAYYTALIASKLDIQKGIDEYDDCDDPSLKFGIKINSTCIVNKMCFNYETIDAALGDETLLRPLCPHCKREMDNMPPSKLNDSKYMIIGNCREHGEFVDMLKFSQLSESILQLSESIYKIDDSNREYFINKINNSSK